MFCGAPSDCRSTASALLLCLQKSPDTHALLSYEQWKRTTHRITLFAFLAHWLQIKTTNFTFLSPFLNVHRFIYGCPFILVLNKNLLHINFNDIAQRSKIVSIDFTNSQIAETQCLFEIGQHFKRREHCNEAVSWDVSEKLTVGAFTSTHQTWEWRLTFKSHSWHFYCWKWPNAHSTSGNIHGCFVFLFRIRFSDGIHMEDHKCHGNSNKIQMGCNKLSDWLESHTHPIH